jgi:hypothetical protein
VSAGRPVEISIETVRLHGVAVRDPDAFRDRLSTDLTHLVANRGLPRPAASPRPPTLRPELAVADLADDDRLAGALAEAIWDSLDQIPVSVEEAR